MENNENQELHNFIEELKEAMKPNELTVKSFAKEMGVSHTIVYKWLNESVEMSTSRYFKAKEVLKKFKDNANS